jgi:hypothetical protein
MLLSAQEKVDGLIAALAKGVNDGEIPEQQVKQAIARIRRLKGKYPYRGIGDLSGLRQGQDIAFAQELFQKVKDEAGDPGDRAA